MNYIFLEQTAINMVTFCYWFKYLGWNLIIDIELFVDWQINQ